ncbi:MAG: T9SS type A sorting domain-containing protein [Melioribacteraceae bacterium]|nr:T9SS type A sorting domain-containing protein [Melioribacteraceae bacterium]
MIYLNIFYILFFFSSFLFAQHLELIGPPGGFVRGNQLAIHPSSPRIVYSATWNGALFKTEGTGNAITPIETDLKDFQITEIVLPRNNLDTIILKAGLSIRSINGGNSWVVLEPTALDANYIFNPQNQQIIYKSRREKKELWRSNDLGDTWEHLHTFNEMILSMAISHTDTSKIYVTTLWGSLFRSTDSGRSWELRNTENVFRGTPWLIEISPYNDNTVYVGASGIYKSNDGGKTFSVQLEGNNLTSFAVNPLDTLTLYASVDDYAFAPDGGIIKTTNEGETWETIVNGIEGSYVTANTLRMNPQNPEELYAGIGSLGVYKTTNGGENWFLTNLAYSDVYTIYIDKENPGTLLTGQYGWAIMKTGNYGEDWHHPKFNTPFQELPVLEIEFNPFNLDEGYAASEYGLFKTTDRGESWIYSTNMEKMQTVSYHPEVEGLIFASSVESDFFEGGLDAVYKSTDGGESWKIVSTERIIQFDYDKNDSELIYALGQRYSFLYKSTDQGENWEVILKQDDIPQYPWAYPSSLVVSSIDQKLIYIGFRKKDDDKGMLLYSSDGGENWTRIDSKLNELDNGGHVATIWLDELQSGRMYVGTYSFGQPLTNNFSNGGLYLTEDNGNNWRKVYGSAVNVIKADNESPRNMYIGTKFGVKTFVDTLTVTSVRDDEKEILPSEYALYQNYPNPFNPSTQIKYAIPNGTNVKLKVFDILGKEIITLVNSYKNAGSHDVKFNAENLPSGVYIYRMEAGNFKANQKMLLIK